MNYQTTITSKGTITIAAPLRKALGLKSGQKLNLRIDRDHQLIIDSGTSIAAFEALRESIVHKIPPHKKALTGQALSEARSKAWIDVRD